MSAQLTADHYRRLYVAFKDAYGVGDIVLFTKLTLDGFHKDEFDTRTIDGFLDDLFARLDRRDEWARYLTEARQGDRKTNRQFIAVVDEILAHLEAEPAQGGGRDDPMESLLLLRGLPFVNRQEVRDAFRDMDLASGWCGLALIGPKQVGKTYCHQYLAFLRLTKWKEDRIAQVILGEQSGYVMRPDELVRLLVLTVRRGTQPLPDPPPNLKEDRWASHLAVWLSNQVDEAGVRVWVVLDGFDHPDVPDVTHSFIATLVQEAANRSNLRVVLLGYARYNEVLPESARPSLPCKHLAFLSVEELERFFDDLDARRPFRNHPQYSADRRPAEEFVRLYRALPPEADEIRARAIKEGLPQVVARLLRYESVPIGVAP